MLLMLMSLSCLTISTERLGVNQGAFELERNWQANWKAKGILDQQLIFGKDWIEVDRANELREVKPKLSHEDYKSLEGAALTRNVAPACVRISTANGQESGFFFKEGGHVVTCQADSFRSRW